MINPIVINKWSKIIKSVFKGNDKRIKSEDEVKKKPFENPISDKSDSDKQVIKDHRIFL